MLDFFDAGDGNPLDGKPPIDGNDFLRLEMAAGEIATYMHTLTGSIVKALGAITPPLAIGKGVRGRQGWDTHGEQLSLTHRQRQGGQERALELENRCRCHFSGLLQQL